MTTTTTNELHTTIIVLLDQYDVEQIISDHLDIPSNADIYINCSYAEATWTTITKLPNDFTHTA